MKTLISVIIVIVVLVGGYYAYMNHLKNQPCIQVVADAENIFTKQSKEFPTPCQIPFWYKQTSIHAKDIK